MTEDPVGERVLRIGAGILDSDVLRAAVELELFRVLGERSMMAPEVCEHLRADPVHVHDFLDALVEVGLLLRIGDGRDDSEYRSAADPQVLIAILEARHR